MSEENKDVDAIIQQNPSIKIEKNTKGYNFSFRILSIDIEEMDKVHNAIVAKIKQWEGPAKEDSVGVNSPAELGQI